MWNQIINIANKNGKKEQKSLLFELHIVCVEVLSANNNKPFGTMSMGTRINNVNFRTWLLVVQNCENAIFVHSARNVHPFRFDRSMEYDIFAFVSSGVARFKSQSATKIVSFFVCFASTPHCLLSVFIKIIAVVTLKAFTNRLHEITSSLEHTEIIVRLNGPGPMQQKTKRYWELLRREIFKRDWRIFFSTLPLNLLLPFHSDAYLSFILHKYIDAFVWIFSVVEKSPRLYSSWVCFAAAAAASATKIHDLIAAEMERIRMFNSIKNGGVDGIHHESLQTDWHDWFIASAPDASLKGNPFESRVNVTEINPKRLINAIYLSVGWVWQQFEAKKRAHSVVQQHFQLNALEEQTPFVFSAIEQQRIAWL